MGRLEGLGPQLTVVDSTDSFELGVSIQVFQCCEVQHCLILISFIVMYRSDLLFHG